MFGWDITHSPVNSTRASTDAVRSSINLAADGVSLLDLLKKWQELTAAHHPLVDTYGAMTTDKDQHPRSRFLLLLQALEGSYGFENLARHEADKESYGAKRRSFMDRAKELLCAADMKFMDKHLRKEPQQGLDSALAEVLKRMPAAISEELEKTELVKRVRSEHLGKDELQLQTVLTRARNFLSHGSRSFESHVLSEVADIVERIVRSEAIRLLGAPVGAQERALKQRDH